MGWNDHYVLDGKEPVLEPDFYKWAEWFETADRTVRFTVTEFHEVSTVFIGINHNFWEGPPLLFETLVYTESSELDGRMARYSTWSKAEAGHEAIVREALASEVSPGRSMLEAALKKGK